MYVIHRMVRRMQLYLDDEMARLLTTESRRRGTAMSKLVRDAVAQQYGRQASNDRGAIIDRLASIWADREDLGNTADMVRISKAGPR